MRKPFSFDYRLFKTEFDSLGEFLLEFGRSPYRFQYDPF